MVLSARDAQIIVDEMKESIHKDLNMMDSTGKIIASTDARRINQIHQGARMLIEQGLPLLTVYDADRQGMQPGVNLPITLDGETVGVIGITGNPEAVEVLGSVIKKMTEIMLSSLLYQEQTEQLDSAQSLFLESWLFGEILDLSEFEMRGNLLGIDVGQPRAVAVIEVFPRDGRAGENAGELQHTQYLKHIRQGLRKQTQTLCAVIHQRIFLSFAGRSQEQIVRQVQELCHEIESYASVWVYAGISSFSRDCLDLRRCYLEAKTACRVAWQSGYKRIALYNEASLEFLTQSIAPNVRRDLLQMVFSSCTQEEVREMMDTLRLYFQNDGNTERAATQAFIHKNTFQYRIGKIRDKTGYHLRNPKDAVLLYLALQFYEEQA